MEPAAGSEPVSVHEGAASTVQPMQTTTSHHAEEIREIAQPEHEQMAIEREKLSAERERMIEEECSRSNGESEARITELEARLAQVWADFESARALRISKEAGRKERERLEDLEGREGTGTQPSDIANIVQEQQDEHARKELRWNEKMNRRVEKDAQISNPYDIVTRITEDREAERIRREEERTAAESRPGALISHHGSVFGVVLKFPRDQTCVGGACSSRCGAARVTGPDF